MSQKSLGLPVLVSDAKQGTIFAAPRASTILHSAKDKIRIALVEHRREESITS